MTSSKAAKPQNSTKVMKKVQDSKEMGNTRSLHLRSMDCQVDHPVNIPSSRLDFVSGRGCDYRGRRRRGLSFGYQDEDHHCGIELSEGDPNEGAARQIRAYIFGWNPVCATLCRKSPFLHPKAA